jgi:hypothetical protein
MFVAAEGNDSSPQAGRKVCSCQRKRILAPEERFGHFGCGCIAARLSFGSEDGTRSGAQKSLIRVIR